MAFYFFSYFRQLIAIAAAVFVLIQLVRLMLMYRHSMVSLRLVSFRRLFFKKRGLGIYFLILLVIYAALTPFMCGYRSQMLLSLNYSNAYQGLNPNGTRYNQAVILSDEILEFAIKKGAFENVTASDLKEALKVVPVAEGSSSDPNEYYISTQYKISYSAVPATAKLDGKLACQLVLEAYKEWFIQNYSLNTSLLEVDFESIRRLDYLDIYETLSTKAGNIGQFMLTMAESNPNFRSEHTGETFSTLCQRAYTVRDVMAENLYAYVLEHGVSKDKGTYLGRLSFENTMLGFESDKERASNQNNLEAISMYENDIATAVLVPTYDENSQYYMSRTRIGVDDFASRAENHATAMTEIRSQIAENMHVASMLTEVTPNASDMDTADVLVLQIETELSNIIEDIITTIREYNEQVTNQYMSIGEVPRYSPIMDVIKTSVIWWGIAIVLVYLGYIIKDLLKEEKL